MQAREQIRLDMRLNPFGNRVDSKSFSQRNHAGDEIFRPLIFRYALDEPHVDLQFVKRNLVKVLQTRITLTEIIERKTKSAAADTVNGGSCQCCIFNPGRFRQFKSEA